MGRETKSAMELIKTSSDPYDASIHREWALRAFSETTGLEIGMSNITEPPRTLRFSDDTEERQEVPFDCGTGFVWISERSSWVHRGRFEEHASADVVAEEEALKRHILLYWEDLRHAEKFRLGQYGVTATTKYLEELRKLRHLLVLFKDAQRYEPPGLPDIHALPRVAFTSHDSSQPSPVCPYPPEMVLDWCLSYVEQEMESGVMPAVADLHDEIKRAKELVKHYKENGGEYTTELAEAKTRRSDLQEQLRSYSEREGGQGDKYWYRRSLVRKLLTVKRGEYRSPSTKNPWRHESKELQITFPVFGRLAHWVPAEEHLIDAILLHRAFGSFKDDVLLTLRAAAILLMAMGINEPDTPDDDDAIKTPGDYLVDLEEEVERDWGKIQAALQTKNEQG